MVSLAALLVWRFHPAVIFFPFLVIISIDGLYLSSALTKVPDGAWFTLTLAAILASLFILWRFGKEQQWRAEAEDRIPTSRLVTLDQDGQLRLTDNYGGSTLSSVRGFGVFFDKAGETTPMVFTQFLSKLVAIPEVMVLFHLRPLEVPTVPVEERCTMTRLSIPNCYRLVVRHGYTDEVITPDLAALIYEELRNYIILRGNHAPRKIPSDDDDPTLPPATEPAPTPSSGEPSSSSATDAEASPPQHTVGADLARLQKAYDHQVLYIIGKEQLRVKRTTPLAKRALLHFFVWLRDNTRTKIANLRVPTERVVEMGFVKEL